MWFLHFIKLVLPRYITFSSPVFLDLTFLLSKKNAILNKIAEHIPYFRPKRAGVSEYVYLK
jgi:hypothetical protein